MHSELVKAGRHVAAGRLLPSRHFHPHHRPIPKNKRPVPSKASTTPVEDDDLLASQMAELTLALPEQWL